MTSFSKFKKQLFKKSKKPSKKQVSNDYGNNFFFFKSVQYNGLTMGAYQLKDLKNNKPKLFWNVLEYFNFTFVWEKSIFFYQKTHTLKF
jgi:hypothetical protein